MEELLKQILSQNGIIAMLFVASFFLFIYRGIPFAVGKFDEIFLSFKEMQDKQHAFFREELQTISKTFIEQVQSSHEWHVSHDRKLNNIESQIEHIKNQSIR